MPITVVLDACVLLPYALSDLLLRLAEADLFIPLWSDELLDEVQRNLTGTFELGADRADRRVSQMRRAFPTALVEGYESLVPAMRNDPKDRHVLAAAVHGGAAVIVTANLKDFPADALRPYGITAVHPDEFLLDQLDLYPANTIAVVEGQRAAYRKPAMTKAEFRDSLRRMVPKFVEEIARVESRLLDPSLPLPLEASSAQAAHEAFFPGSGVPDGTTPLGVAYLWWSLLAEYSPVFDAHIDRLCENPSVWDYPAVAHQIAPLAIMQAVHESSEPNICYVKLIRGVSGAARAFAESYLHDVEIVTLTRSPVDGLWRVWGLSSNYFPSVDEIQPPASTDQERTAAE